MISRELTAFNTATESANKIHDDDTARRFGFSGGLVPGVEVHGYLSWGPVSVWGERWLAGGEMTSRYAAPTYDGARVRVSFDESTGQASVSSQAGTEASATCSLPSAKARIPTVAEFPHVALPDDRPAADERSLVPGSNLGSIDVVFPDEKADTYLEAVREVLPIYADQGLAHPGWVLGLANLSLTQNVVLGPWIHVGSTVRNLGLIRTGQLVSARARVADRYEKKGHRFVELDVAVFADERAAASIRHVAIYEPRQVREAPQK